MVKSTTNPYISILTDVFLLKKFSISYFEVFGFTRIRCRLAATIKSGALPRTPQKGTRPLHPITWWALPPMPPILAGRQAGGGMVTPPPALPEDTPQVDILSRVRALPASVSGQPERLPLTVVDWGISWMTAGRIPVGKPARLTSEGDSLPPLRAGGGWVLNSSPLGDTLLLQIKERKSAPFGTLFLTSLPLR